MAVADSMFMFEIIVEELKSLINCKEFCIKSQFADIFSLHLDDPNEYPPYILQRAKKTKRKTKLKRSSKCSVIPKTQTGQSVVFANNVEYLISSMKQYPMELSLWSKIIPDYKIGSTHIAWSSPYFEYLNKHHKKQDSVCVKGDYNIFDEVTSRRMAVIKLNIKLSYVKDTEKSQIQYVPPHNQEPLVNTVCDSTYKIKKIPSKLTEETSMVKAIYKDEIVKSKKAELNAIQDAYNKDHLSALDIVEVNSKTCDNILNSGIVALVRSNLNLQNDRLSVVKSKSCSNIIQENNMLDYIFGGKPAGLFGNQVYCVGYFTVQKDSPKSVQSEKASGKNTPQKNSPEKSKASSVNSDNHSDQSDQTPPREKYKFRICDPDCPAKKLQNVSGTLSTCSLDLPIEASHLIRVKRCDYVDCDGKKWRPPRTPPDDAIYLDLGEPRDCCAVTEKVEEVVGGMTAKMKFGNKPCYCECECKFGFMKKTTFCNICGGYENFGDEYQKVPAAELPFPCPIFHKLVDQSKINTSEGESKREKKELAETKKDKKDATEITKDRKEMTDAKSKKEAEGNDTKKDKKKISRQKSTVVDRKSVESIKDQSKKGKKRKKDSRFKFNYGYQGIPPQIGHSRCLLPCTGTLGAVPTRMGWLWNAENVPGMKFRPLWKPGAANKHVVRLLKIAKNPGEAMSKKRKKDTGKVKRPLKRPLLVVHKKDGEYTVTMETMKSYAKPRTFNQHPYEDKPVLTYTIGRTSEENLQRRKRKIHNQNVLEMCQRQFIQGAFKDMCQDICLKTYQQALGILPNAEIPDCPCYPIIRDPERVELERSCSCSIENLPPGSVSDDDEWILEFTPPTAKFDPTYKCKKVATADISTQYTYLDYRVKLLDRYGNPVPRFFKGPDGKQECSDLGGFWGPDNKWLEINTDGYIGPDGRWAPNTFIGPTGEIVDGETGKFQSVDGEWLVVGVDGYVEMGKWKLYSKPKPPPPKKERSRKKKKIKKQEKKTTKPSDATWSCLGSVSPRQLSKMGIVGHGQDKKLLLKKLRDMLAHGEDVKIPEPKIVPKSGKKYKGRRDSFVERRKCKHATPSSKGIVAVDGHGNKIYFRLKDVKNRRPKDRLTTLTEQGISLSSFHVPCFHSFISAELMKKQRYDRLVALAKAASVREGDRRRQSPQSSTREHNTAAAGTQAATEPMYTYVV